MFTPTGMCSSMKVAIISIVFVLAELTTFYFYSFLFLLEGEPSRHGDPKLAQWAYLLIGLMVAEAIAYLLALFVLRCTGSDNKGT